MNQRSLYRSVDDRIIGGVAGGIGEYFDVDPSIVRILWVLAAFVTAGLALIAYIIMLVVVPEDPEPWASGPPSQPRPGPSSAGYAASYEPPPGQAGAEQPVGQPAQPADPVDSTQSWMPTGAAEPKMWGPGPSPFTPGNYADRRWQRRQDRWQRRQQRREERARRWSEGAGDWGRHEHGRSSGAIMWGLLLILVGGVLLLQRFDPAFDLARTWPLLAIGFGVILVAFSVVRGLADRP